MSGFHTATICADCDPPVVAISTGDGSRCPRCGQIETWSRLTTEALDEGLDGLLARRILHATAVRSDDDARLLAELSRRLLDRAGRDGEALEEGLRDRAEEVTAGAGAAVPVSACPHCAVGEPSVWDDFFFHYAHPADGSKIKFCYEPWRERCRRCSASLPSSDEPCTSATCDPNYRCTCLRHDQGFGTERHTHACARRYAETRRELTEDSP